MQAMSLEGQVTPFAKTTEQLVQRPRPQRPRPSQALEAMAQAAGSSWLKEIGGLLGPSSRHLLVEKRWK